MTAPKKVRRAGTRWRVLVHEALQRGRDGDAWHITSDKRFGGGTGEDRSLEADGRVYHTRYVEYPGTEFDELVVGRWLHIEQMDMGCWWMNIGGVTVDVRADRDGRPKWVRVHGPHDYASPVEGCEYEVYWRDRSGGAS